MSTIKYSLAFVLGVFLQTLLVGLFLPLLIVASYVQWKKVSKGRKVNPVMAFATVFFGLSILAHWILGLRRAVFATLYLPSGMTVDKYLIFPLGADEIIRRSIFQFQIVIGDAIMVYRMYHIYDKSLLACAIPSITTAGLFVIGVGLTNQLRNLNTPADFKAYDNWAAACFCVTLFNSAFMSAAISIRLWMVHRGTAVCDVVNSKESVILRAMRVLVESAALWTFMVAVNFFAFLAKSNLRHTFLIMTSPVVGISFCLIIVRLGAMSPEVREDSWGISQRSRSSRVLPFSDSRVSKLPVPLDRVKVERDVYVDEFQGDAMEFHVIGPTPPGGKRAPVR